MHAKLTEILEYVLQQRQAGEEVDPDLAKLAGVIDLMVNARTDQGLELSFEEAMEDWVVCLRDEREAGEV
jgi:hypothetical protein